MFYDDNLIIGRVPKKIKDRTKENMEDAYGNNRNKSRRKR